MTVLLHCIRHSPVVKTGICYGQTDVAVAPFLPQSAIAQCVVRCDEVYTSPLARCLTMATAYAGNREILVDGRLMEMSFGHWEGSAWAAISPDLLSAWAADVRYFCPPNGECFDNVVRRVQLWLAELTQGPLEEVAVFTHAGVIKALRVLLLKEPFAEAAVYQAPYHQVLTFELANGSD